MQTWKTRLEVLIVLLSVLMVGSVGGTSPVQAEEATVYVVVHGGIVDPFWKVVEKGVKDAAALYPDLNVIYTGPEQYDLGKFLSLVDEAIAARPQGLIVTITSYLELAEPLQRAMNMGIPVIAINAMDPRPAGERIPYLTYIGEDHAQMGALVAREMMRLMKQKGFMPQRGVYGNHHPKAYNITQRAQGFIETLTAAGIPAEQLDVTTDPAKGAELLLAYLKAHPDANMVQPGNTLYTEAFVARVEQEGQYTLGKNLFVATIDLSPKVLEYVHAGKVLLTADQQQYLQGYLAVVHTYLKITHGFVPPPLISTGEAVVTADLVPHVKNLVEQGYK